MKVSFKHIPELKWDPYVGKNYFRNNIRILVIGESHYKDDDGKYKERKFTNHVVQGHAIKENNYSKLFPNFHKALFGDMQYDKQKLWDHLAFYNFVQRSLDSNRERPAKMDFENGWLTFFKVIEVLKPTCCLFIGISASKMFQKGCQVNGNIKILNFERGPNIQNTFPRKFSLKTDSQEVIDGMFIKHTSQYFSWSKWNEYLDKEIMEEIKWLKQIVK